LDHIRLNRDFIQLKQPKHSDNNVFIFWNTFIFRSAYPRQKRPNSQMKGRPSPLGELKPREGTSQQPVAFPDRSISNSIRPEIGHSIKVYVPRWAQTIRKTFSSVRICNSWNSLPQQVIEAVNEFVQEQTRQVLVRHGHVKVPSVEPIYNNYKYLTIHPTPGGSQEMTITERCSKSHHCCGIRGVNTVWYAVISTLLLRRLWFLRLFRPRETAGHLVTTLRVLTHSFITVNINVLPTVMLSWFPDVNLFI